VETGGHGHMLALPAGGAFEGWQVRGKKMGTGLVAGVVSDG
jgi:hypothetical protein